MMKFPAPEKKKPKLAFSANISGAMGRRQEKEVSKIERGGEERVEKSWEQKRHFREVSFYMDLIFNVNISTRQVMEMPQQLKMKAASKAVKLNVNMSQVGKRSK